MSQMLPKRPGRICNWESEEKPEHLSATNIIDVDINNRDRCKWTRDGDTCSRHTPNSYLGRPYFVGLLQEGVP
jgi:hypothetical protein